MPTGQVFRWHWRAMTHPMARREAVPKPNSSAPRIAAKTISRANFRPPSTRRERRERRLARTNFPGQAGVFDGGQRRRTGATVVPADSNNVRACLCYARGDDAHASAGNKFYADAGARIHGAEVVDQLREIFDAVNVVMWRRRNQRRARGRVADARDVLADFLGGQLAALTGLGALGHFDFEFFSVDEIIRSDPKTRGGDLLNLVGGGRLVAIRVGIFAAFTG